ncbi:hypothetical protein B0H17DRAFT_1156022 [Mycena rosella]|uniref:Uncharacterized protein n=1 Tax=Mycena rosella TaxID=1033263 RepID=A0AAD7GYT5_MYCRO|nr:hypothetical protein B0H17DRAFT_1156022 [Mycena rosella]
MAPPKGTGKKISCRHCGSGFLPKGINRHESACVAGKAIEEKNTQFIKRLQAEKQNPGCGEDPASDEYGPDTEQPVPGPTPPEEVKRIFHPHSKRSPTFQSFNEYVASSVAEQPAPVDDQPWRPFRSQLDFEVAEFCENNMLNKDSTETLISLIRRCGSNPTEFTLANQLRYKNEDKEFDTYTRPLWDWVLSLVQDTRLASCFVWDSEKAYKFNGESYIRFYHEPWTADAFWAAQVTARPVCLSVYADKSKLSSFGTQKAYPVVENGKPAFSNFKNIVWHTAFYKLLESLVDPSKVGNWTVCGDSITRWLWPKILILAADYEEACVMSLIHGLQGLYLCPICFVPWNEQSDLSTEHPLRTGLGSQLIVEEARMKRTALEREEILKDNGLRDVDNVFWKIGNTDPHEAISYDPLHADDGGFWGDHLFGQLKARVPELGRAVIVKIDAQMAKFPRWRGLNHFETVMNTSFNDGSKHEDIAKTMLFVAHNVLVDDAGLLLLKALRSYLEMRTSIGFGVHTSATIAAGRREVLTLDAIMKNWNFPKFHARRHVFDDIEKKGASRNFGTKTSESMHRAIRQTYHRLTNFKMLKLNTQLVKHDHRRTVATFIRDQIDAHDEDTEESPEDLESLLSNVDIGSKLKPVSFLSLEQSMSHDHAFDRFRFKFGDFISDFLPAHGYNLPNGKRLRFDGHEEACCTWTSTADYLRCNPKFHSHPRYDGVLVKTANKPFFAQLISLFSCMVEEKSHAFAPVLPLDAPTGRLSRKDNVLRFHWVHAKPRKNSEFISVHSIIRGALLAPDSDKPDEYIVVDILDGDISLRMKDLYPDCHGA